MTDATIPKDPTEDDILQFLQEAEGEPNRADARKFLRARNCRMDLCIKLWNNFNELKAELKYETPMNSEIFRSDLKSKALIVGNELDKKTGCLVVSYLVDLHSSTIPRVEVLRSLLTVLDFELERQEEVQSQGLVLLFDLTNATFSNFDFEATEYLLNFFQNQFPSIVRKILILNPTWWASILLRAITAVIDTEITYIQSRIAKITHLVSGDNLNEHISLDSLPNVIVGGKADFDREKWVEAMIEGMRNFYGNDDDMEDEIEDVFIKEEDELGIDLGGRPPEWKESTTAIHKSQLKDFIIKLMQENGFMRQFYWILNEENTRPADHTTAKKVENRTLNRYTNVLPLEHTRVKLKDGTDYINANYVEGFKKELFISCQGPLENTSEHFWQMIWEQNVYTMVMATRCIENNRIKCHQYWPKLDETVTYGKYEITSVLETNCEGFSYGWRDFKIRNTELDETRNVVHYQYFSWPDHGVPSSSRNVLELLELVNERQRKLKEDDDKEIGPIVVHCSAGIGRTGTFMAIDISCKYLKEYGWVDVIDTVNTLRTFRGGLVQTVDQYQFCYVATYEYLDFLKN